MSADVLLPETDRDVVALLAHLMSAQHELVLAMHGPVRHWTCRMRVAPGKASMPDAGARACRTRRWQRCPSRPPPRRSSSPTGFCSSRTTRPRLSTWRTTLCRTSPRPPTRCAAGQSPAEPALIAARSSATCGLPSARLQGRRPAAAAPDRAGRAAADAVQDLAQPGQERRLWQARVVPERAKGGDQRPGVRGDRPLRPARAALPLPIWAVRCVPRGTARRTPPRAPGSQARPPRSSPERRAPRPTGVFVDPQAIAISPRVLHVEATGVNISPAGISIGPILIAVTPSGTNIGLTHVAVRAAPPSPPRRPAPPKPCPTLCGLV